MTAAAPGSRPVREAVRSSPRHGARRPVSPARRASGPERPGLRVVRPAPRRDGRVGFLAFAVVLVAALVLGLVTLQAVVSEESFRMQEIARRNAALQQRSGELQLEVAWLSAPERIAREAKRLGLRLPDEVETITVPPGARRGDGPDITGPSLSTGLVGRP
jgi:cell division protein FtsL